MIPSLKGLCGGKCVLAGLVSCLSATAKRSGQNTAHADSAKKYSPHLPPLPIRHACSHGFLQAGGLSSARINLVARQARRDVGLGLGEWRVQHHLDRTKYLQRYSGALGGDHHRKQAVEMLLTPLEKALHSQAYLGGEQPCQSPCCWQLQVVRQSCHPLA